MGRPVTRVLLGLSLLAASFIAACGYFNTMYNADRAFTEAERAASRGDAPQAASSYMRAARKAAMQIAKDSTGRYSDDAMLILGRSWFALGALDSADAVLRRLAERQSAPLRDAAAAWLGAVSAARNDTAAALQSLNAALQSDRLDDYTSGIAHLWRARVRFSMNDLAGARGDLETAARASDRLAAPAALLGARIALESNDTAALRTHFDQLFRSAAGAFFTDSIRALAREYGARDPITLVNGMSSVHDADWPRMRRDSIALLLVSLLEQSGDTARAVAEAQRIARRSTPPLSDDARVVAARMLLARARNAGELTAIRNLLLPALANTGARTIVQTMKTIDVLVGNAAQTGQPLALFVAAEIARDQLGAPGLARQLFLAYAEIARGSDWSGKALLAAAALPQPPDSAEAVRRRIAELPANVYIAAINGQDDSEAFASAEERLARISTELRNAAVIEAAQRETTVGRSVALIDSVRLAARTDSLRISCGVLIDSLAVRGIRADSIRSACMRSDRERINILIQIDTLLLRDTTQAKPDSLQAKPDTLRVRGDTATFRS